MRVPRALEKIAPARSPYRDAEAAWFEGDYRRTLEILAEWAPRARPDKADASLLAARANLRAGDAGAALHDARAGLLAADDLDRRAAGLMLQGAALARLGELAEARRLLEEARRDPRVHSTIAAEALLQEAFVSYKERDLETARTLATEASRNATDIVLARALELLGYIEVAEERYGRAFDWFGMSLETLDRSRHHDRLLEANLLHVAAALAFEMLAIDSLAGFRARLGRLHLTGDMNATAFQLHQSVGWLALVAGEEAEAWRRFQDALAVIGDDGAYRMMALTNLASLSRLVNDRFSAQQYVDTAFELLKCVDWVAADGDHRYALVELSMEVARGKTGDARAPLAIYQRLPPASGDKAFDVHDRRVAAGLLAAQGLCQPPPERAGLLREALTQWKALGYRYRALITAVDLYHATQDGDDLRAAKRLSRGLKSGPIAREIDAALARERSGLPKLTPALRRVLFGILEGKSALDIAADSRKAVQTIKNQTRKIFQEMGVSTRAELIVHCARLGVTAGPGTEPATKRKRRAAPPLPRLGG